MNKMKIFVNRKLHFVLLPFLRSLSFVCPAIGARRIAVVAKLEAMRVKTSRMEEIRSACECESLFKVDKIAQNSRFDVFNSNSSQSAVAVCNHDPDI